MNTITETVQFATINAHIANFYDYSRRLLQPAVDVIFLEWAEHQTFVNGAPYGFKYGVFVDILNNHYNVLEKDIQFNQKYMVGEDDELIPLKH